MKALLALAFMASVATAAPTSKNVDTYFQEFEGCKIADGNASDPHCKAMKVAEKKAIKEGCQPTGVGVDFHFERKDKSEC